MAYTQAHNKANQRYQLKAYDRVYIRVRKGEKEELTQLAEKSKKSLQAYIIDAVNKQRAYDETGENEIDGKVFVNLMNWLKEHGHNPDEIVDCLKSLSKDLPEVKTE